MERVSLGVCLPAWTCVSLLYNAFSGGLDILMVLEGACRLVPLPLLPGTARALNQSALMNQRADPL